MPTACMKAYMVVGPTKLNPRFLRSVLKDFDSGVWAGTSPNLRGAARLAAGANDQTCEANEPNDSTTLRAHRALLMVDSIFPR